MDKSKKNDDSKKSDEEHSHNWSTSKSSRKVPRDRIRSTPSYRDGPSNSPGTSSLGPSITQDVSESLDSLCIDGSNYTSISESVIPSSSSSLGTFAAIPSLTTDTEPTGSEETSTTCLMAAQTFVKACEFMFKAYSITDDSMDTFEDSPKSDSIVDQAESEMTFMMSSPQGSQTEDLDSFQNQPIKTKAQLEAGQINKPLNTSPKKAIPRDEHIPEESGSPKTRLTTKDGSSPEAGPSTKVEPSRPKSSDFSRSEVEAGGSPKKTKPRVAKIKQLEEVDPSSAPILPDQYSTIDIKTTNGILGLSVLGGKDTAVNGPAAVVNDIYNGGVIYKDGRLKIGDQIKECNEVQFTEDMVHERIVMTIKQPTHKLRLVVYRPDPIPFMEFSVELTREPGQPLGLTFRAPSSGQGVYFGDPMPHSPVQRNGRIKKGDILLSVDDKEITTSDFLTVAATLKLIGDKTVIKVRRFIVV